VLAPHWGELVVFQGAIEPPDHSLGDLDGVALLVVGGDQSSNSVSPFGVRSIWLRHDLSTMKHRLSARSLDGAVAVAFHRGAQVAALEKALNPSCLTIAEISLCEISLVRCIMPNCSFVPPNCRSKDAEIIDQARLEHEQIHEFVLRLNDREGQ